MDKGSPPMDNPNAQVPIWSQFFGLLSLGICDNPTALEGYEIQSKTTGD